MTNKHIELPALPEVIQMGSRSAKDVMREYARTAVIADRAAQQRVPAEQARVVGEPVAWAATSEDGKVEALGFNQSRRFDTPLVFASPPAPQEAQAGIALAIHYPDCWDTAAYPTMQSALVEVYAHFCCTNQDTHVVASGQEERADAEAFWRWFYRKCPAILSDKVRALWMESSEYAEMLAATVAQPATEQAEAPRSMTQAEHEVMRKAQLSSGTVVHSGRLATQPTASNAGERELDLYDEIECDLPSLFGRASLEGHESGQRLAHQVRTKMQAARAALASKPAEPVAPPAREAQDNVELCKTLMQIARSDEAPSWSQRFAIGQAIGILSATTPAPAGQSDALRELFALHAAEVENNPYAYCEVAYTRATGWMAWITDKPLACVVESPDRKVLLRGQGDTPEEAAAAALRAARGDEVNQK